MTLYAAQQASIRKPGQVIQSRRKRSKMKKERTHKPSQATPGQRLLAERYGVLN